VVGTATIGYQSSTDSVAFPLSAGTVDSWLGDTTNYGLLLETDPAATFLKRFWSRTVSNDSLRPRIYVYGDFVDGGETFADSVVTSVGVTSAFLVDDREVVDTSPGRVIISDSYIRRALLQGNFGSLSPQTTSLIRVELILFPDPDWTNQMGNLGILTYNEVTTNWDQYPDSLGRESWSTTGFTMPGDSSMIRIEMTRLARQWQSDPTSNHGVSLEPVIYGTSIGRGAFFDETAADPEKKPYFRVVYSEYTE
jgi:hypothetical protein